MLYCPSTSYCPSTLYCPVCAPPFLGTRRRILDRMSLAAHSGSSVFGGVNERRFMISFLLGRSFKPFITAANDILRNALSYLANASGAYLEDAMNPAPSELTSLLRTAPSVPGSPGRSTPLAQIAAYDNLPRARVPGGTHGSRGTRRAKRAPRATLVIQSMVAIQAMILRQAMLVRQAIHVRHVM